MADARQSIDAFLGQGFYDEWQNMDRRLDREGRQFDLNRGRLRIPLTSPLIDRIWDSLSLANKIAKDYARGMNLVTSGGRVTKKKLLEIHDIYTLALPLVEQENDILDATWVTGFAAMWVVFPFLLLEARSREFEEALRKLVDALHEAERNVTKAKAKMYIHGVAAVFEAMFPEISLTARAAIYLGDVALDKVLGERDAPASKTYPGIVTPGVKQFSEAVDGIEAYGETAREFAKKTGKVATVATFWFDHQELGEGVERVERIKDLLEETKRAYDSLKMVIATNRPKLEQFMLGYERWMTSIKGAVDTAANMRRQLYDDMTAIGYSSIGTFIWN